MVARNDDINIDTLTNTCYTITGHLKAIIAGAFIRSTSVNALLYTSTIVSLTLINV